MATIAPSMFSTSTSSFRASQSAQAISYADNSLTQLPTVDFNFEDLRQRMAAFTAKFDAFIEKGRKRVLEERNEFRGRLGEQGEEQRSANAQITTYQSTLSAHSQVLSREQSEKNEMIAQISQLESHHASEMASRDRLKTAISHAHQQIEAKLQAQCEYARKVDRQSRMNGPELNFWEHYLGCRLDGGGENGLIRVTFAFPPPKSGVGKNGEEREATMEVKILDGDEGFEIQYTKPRLNDAEIADVVERANANYSFPTILKGIRRLFAKEMK